jgi:hypothetical protein
VNLSTVFFFALREDQVVVEVGDTSAVNVLLQDMVNEVLERG